MSKKSVAARLDREAKENESFVELRAMNVRLHDICRRLKAREGRISIGLVALQMAYKKQDTIAVNKFMGDLLRGDLREAMTVMTERDLAMKIAIEALVSHATGEWGKTAQTALDQIEKLDPYFMTVHGDQEGQAGSDGQAASAKEREVVQ